MTPVTAVIAETGIVVEVTVLAALVAAHTGDAAVERILGIIAGTETFGVGGIDRPVLVVVHTIAAQKDAILTHRRGAHERTPATR
jgi:hypothetical protein